MRTGELYECVESPFSYSRSWGYTPSRILLYDGWLRHRLLNELFRSLKNSAFHRLSRSVNLEYYAFLVFSNLSNRNDSLKGSRKVHRFVCLQSSASPFLSAPRFRPHAPHPETGFSRTSGLSLREWLCHARS